MKTVDRADWPFKGPRAILELLESVQSSNMELTIYAQHCEKTSGVNPMSAVANEHRVHFLTLTHMICYDCLDVRNLGCAEQIARRILMIQRAVKKNPKAPSFVGLEFYMQSELDSTGGLVTHKFDEHVADLQKTEAIIMKQNRLWTEETIASTKEKREPRDNGKKGKKDKNTEE